MLDNSALLEGMLEISGGVVVVMGASSTYGHLDAPGEVVLQDAGIRGVNFTLTIATGRLPGVRQNSALVVNGTSYNVRDVEPLDDGSLTRLYLMKAPA